MFRFQISLPETIKKAVQNAKGERWDGEEVHRRNGLAMVPEKRQPSLHRM